MKNLRSKKRLAIVTPDFAPAYSWGGPIFSMLNLCDFIKEEYRITVFTSNRLSSQKNSIMSYDQLSQEFPGVDKIIRFTPSAPIFIPISYLSDFVKYIRQNEVVYVNSTYNILVLIAFITSYLSDKTIFWSPRGALSARTSFNRFDLKKIIFEFLIYCTLPRRKSIIICSSTSEQKALPYLFRKYEQKIFPNTFFTTDKMKKRKLARLTGIKYLYLSRIHKIKGIISLLQSVELSKNINLTICGPMELDDKDEFFALLDKFPNIVFKEAKYSVEEKEELYFSHDVMVLPTSHENFGNVIVEALNSGMPVITTKNTPFNEMERFGVGLCCETVDHIASMMSNLSEEQLQKMYNKVPYFLKAKVKAQVKLNYDL